MKQIEGQINIFNLGKEEFKFKKPIRLIELFAGVGSQAMGLRDIGADFEHYKVVEFDKYAIASYNAIHGTNFPVMDVTKIKGADLEIVDQEKYAYLLTYSFPCTDLSVAGKMMGMAEGSGTRSSLLWEVRRLLDECENLPDVLLMENVPQVHSKSNMPHFTKWLDYLDSKGYSSYWQDMNAKEYGVAQSRNRTFVVSILGNYNYTFPKSFPLTKVMKDYLEPTVDEKYYIASDKAKDLIDKLIEGGKILTDRQTNKQSTCAVNMVKQLKSATPLKQDTIRESLISNMTTPVLLKSQECEFVKFTDTANTLMARDYKGFGNQAMNAVIEVKKMNEEKYTLVLNEAEIRLIERGLSRLFDTAIREETEKATSELYKKISESTQITLK